MLDLSSRILLKNGISIVSVDEACKMLFDVGEIQEHIKVEQSNDTKKFIEKYGKDICFDGDIDVMASPKTFISEEQAETLKNKLINSERYNKKYDDRFQKEFDFFFEDSIKLSFLFSVNKLIEQFEKDQIVWGVGRGSSCASLILYMLKIHDIDPVKYEIDFKEFSKE
jgi:DNA polymerase III alpha subunit